jgi:hypothetical protein
LRRQRDRLFAGAAGFDVAPHDEGGNDGNDFLAPALAGIGSVLPPLMQVVSRDLLASNLKSPSSTFGTDERRVRRIEAVRFSASLINQTFTIQRHDYTHCLILRIA